MSIEVRCLYKNKKNKNKFYFHFFLHRHDQIRFHRSFAWGYSNWSMSSMEWDRLSIVVDRNLAFQVLDV